MARLCLSDEGQRLGCGLVASGWNWGTMASRRLVLKRHRSQKRPIGGCGALPTLCMAAHPPTFLRLDTGIPIFSYCVQKSGKLYPPGLPVGEETTWMSPNPSRLKAFVLQSLPRNQWPEGRGRCVCHESATGRDFHRTTLTVTDLDVKPSTALTPAYHMVP